MNKYIHLLRWIGFTDHASNIYISLIENWVSSLSQISNFTWMHRTQIYRTLPYLLESWFIIEVENGKRKMYKPCSPKKIQDEYNNLYLNNNHIIEELDTKFKNSETTSSAIVTKWIKSIHNIYKDITHTLDKWGIFYRVTSELDVEKTNNYYIPDWYKQERDKKQIERYIIMSDKTASFKKPKLEREMKIVNNNDISLDDNIIYTIYWDKISLIDFNTETSILIESKEIAQFQRKLFKLLFKKL